MMLSLQGSGSWRKKQQLEQQVGAVSYETLLPSSGLNQQHE